MRKFLGIVVLTLLLNSNAYAKVGNGELKLSQSTMVKLMLYMYGASNPKYSDGANKKNKPMLMVISVDGKSSYYYYCPYTSCTTGNYVYKAIKRCEKLSNGSPCYLFAKKRSIKWKNSINTKSTNIKKKLLKEPYQIAKIIQDLGFYDDDISKLPGIDYDTAKLDDSTTITGKNDASNFSLKKPKITKKITQSDDDIVSKLKDLKELLDSGVLTKEEFEKAKKKLLN